jgi:hypothetical protein
MGRMTAQTVDTGDVPVAMEQAGLRGKSDDELLELLECLCTRLYLENNRHLPVINQCISINAELLNRYYRHSSRTMSGLALIAALLGLGQLCLFLLR